MNDLPEHLLVISLFIPMYLLFRIGHKNPGVAVRLAELLTGGRT